MAAFGGPRTMSGQPIDRAYRSTLGGGNSERGCSSAARVSGLRRASSQPRLAASTHAYPRRYKRSLLCQCFTSPPPTFFCSFPLLLLTPGASYISFSLHPSLSLSLFLSLSRSLSIPPSFTFSFPPSLPLSPFFPSPRQRLVPGLTQSKTGCLALIIQGWHCLSHTLPSWK